MNLNPPPDPTVFPARRQVTAALQRAADRARVTVEQTGTEVVVSPSPSKPALPVQASVGTERA